MTDFLSSLKADLLDRRMLPLLALLGVALAAALAYAALGGSAGKPAPTAATSTAPTSTGHAGIAVSQAPANAEKSVAEVTSGAAQQRGGYSRNPFTPLPGGQSTTSTTKTSSSSTSSSTSTVSGSSGAQSGSGSSTQGAGGTTPAATPKPSAPAKPQTVYHVAVLFGVAPAGASSPSSQLTPYENLKRSQPLPSSQAPLVVFRGVTTEGKSATFTLVGEAILRGGAACLPSPSQCQAIDLKPGQSEELEYLPPSGQAITYQLQIVSISSSKASTASAQRDFRGESKIGRELLRRAGLVALPGLRYSLKAGVLVFAGHSAFGARAHGARAHAAARRPRHKR
jgi:hypothetical protein